MINIKDRNSTSKICPWCGQPAQIIWVHGHGQCSNCGTNVEECCRGESCENIAVISSPREANDKKGNLSAKD
jgi:hypothetical protein